MCWKQVDWLRRAAERGYAFAQALMSVETHGQESLSWAEKAAAQGERDGFYWLGKFCQQEDECKAECMFRHASELGLVCAMSSLGLLLSASVHEKYLWLGSAAVRGCRNSANIFGNEMVKQVLQFDAGAGHEDVIFAIGRAVRGNINMREKSILGSNCLFDWRVSYAQRSVAFYEACIVAVRQAVDIWTVAGIRSGICSDVRLIVSRLVWNARSDAKHLNCHVGLESISSEDAEIESFDLW